MGVDTRHADRFEWLMRVVQGCTYQVIADEHNLTAEAVRFQVRKVQRELVNREKKYIGSKFTIADEFAGLVKMRADPQKWIDSVNRYLSGAMGPLTL